MNKKYILLYYLSFSIIVVLFLLNRCHFFSNSIIDDGLYFESLSSLLIYVNSVITLIITIFLIKKRKLEGEIIFPISFIVFTIIVIFGCLLFNDRVVVPFVHFGYYANLLILGFTLLNAYTWLGIKKGDNNEK